MRLRAGAAGFTTLALSFSACAGGPNACSEIGGASGVSLSVAPNLYREGRMIDVEICQNDVCESASTPLFEDQGGRVRVVVDFAGFGSKFDEGQAELSMRVRQGSSVIRSAEATVALSHDYPNGRDCDGDHFLYGEAQLR